MLGETVAGSSVAAVKRQEDRHQAILSRPAGESNPYEIHNQLGDIMTRAATVVRRNDQLTQAYERRWPA
jgi:succinate dehydrogenase / fumarate reductase flavoprotein subunit